MIREQSPANAPILVSFDALPCEGTGEQHDGRANLHPVVVGGTATAQGSSCAVAVYVYAILRGCK